MHTTVTKLSRLVLCATGLSLPGCPPPEPDRPEEKTATLPTEPPDPDTAKMERRVAERMQEARRAVLADPASAAAWGRFGEVCDAHFFLDEAELCYRSAIARAPDEFRWRYLHACVIERLSSDVEAVIAGFERAQELDPEYAPLLYRLGKALARAGRMTEALEAHRRAIELDGDFALAHRAVGQVLLALDDPSTALRHLRRAAELLPDDGAVSAAMAQAYTRLGDRENAARAAEQAKRSGQKHTIPDPIREQVEALAISGNACMARAQRLMQSGDFSAALGELEVALEVFPNDPIVHYSAGTAFQRVGRADKARQHLQKAAEGKPDLVPAHVQLAMLYAAGRELERAAQHMRQAVRHAPDDATIRLRLAVLLMRQAEFEAAREEAKKAAELDPRSTGAFTIWGQALLATGDAETAAARLKRAVQLNPRNGRARRLLEAAERRTAEQEAGSKPDPPRNDEP